MFVYHTVKIACLGLACLVLVSCSGSGDSESDASSSNAGSSSSSSSASSSGASGAPVGNPPDDGVSVCTVDCISGQTYYVSNDGDDENNGTSPENAWRTIGHVNQQSFSPGDGVLFRRGDTWRETLRLNSSGNAEDWIVYGGYGEGDERPRILGSDRATGWTQAAGNVWQSETAVDNPYGGGYSLGEVFFETTGEQTVWGREREYDTGHANLTQEYDWSWNDNTLYVYAATDPDERYASVEAPQRDGCVVFPSINGSTVTAEDYVEHVAIDGLEIRYCRRWGIWAGYNEIEASGFRVVNSRIGHIGIKGASSAYCIADWHSDSLFQGNTIHDCGRRGISLNTYTDYTPDLTVQNVTIDGNYFYSGYHTTSIDVSSLPGRGHTFSGITFSNNVVDDTGRHGEGIDEGCASSSCTSNGLFVQTESGNNYSDFTIHNNVFLGSTSRAILVIGPLTGLNIYHNSIYGSHPDANPYGLVVLNDVFNVDMRNNIIHGVLPASAEARCILDEGDTSFSVRNHNLYYQEDPDEPFTGSENGAGGWDTLMSEWDSWRADSGFEASSPAPRDPLFTDPENGEFSLQADSAAVDAGASIAGFNDDYQGNAPDLGAIESAHSSQ